MLENKWFSGCDSYVSIYGHEAFTIYSYLRRNLTLRNTSFFCINDIMDWLGVDKNNTFTKKKIIESLGILGKGLVDIYTDMSCDTRTKGFKSNKIYYVVFKEKIEVNYFTLYDEDIDKIIKSCEDTRNNKFEIVSLFAFYNRRICRDSMSIKYGITRTSLSFISKAMSIDRKTIIRYNKSLIKNNLLLNGRCITTNHNGNYITDKSIYSVIEYEDYFEKYLKIKKVPMNNQTSDSVDLINKQRSLCQRINLLQKKHIENGYLEKSEYEKLHLLECEYIDIVNTRNISKNKKDLITIK